MSTRKDWGCFPYRANHDATEKSLISVRTEEVWDNDDAGTPHNTRGVYTLFSDMDNHFSVARRNYNMTHNSHEGLENDPMGTGDGPGRRAVIEVTYKYPWRRVLFNIKEPDVTDIEGGN